MNARAARLAPPPRRWPYAVAAALLAVFAAVALGELLGWPFLGPPVQRFLSERLERRALFLAIAYASWVPMLNAWEISEYSGEGALRVPTYPVRSVVVAMSLLAAICYVGLAVREFRGDFDATTPPPPTL